VAEEVAKVDVEDLTLLVHHDVVRVSAGSRNQQLFRRTVILDTEIVGICVPATGISLLKAVKHIFIEQTKPFSFPF
jgi:hypothetical protein